MAKFTLTIETDNAAFDDNGLGSELRHMFHDVADKVERGWATAPVFDSNGNNCGRWLIRMDLEDNEEGQQ